MVKYFVDEEKQTISFNISFNLSYANTVTDIVESTSIYNAFAEGMKFELLAGIYRNGALYKAVSSSKSISCTPANATPANVGVSFEIPDDGEDYSVKMFLIDSKAEGSVLHPCIEMQRLPTREVPVV